MAHLVKLDLSMFEVSDDWLLGRLREPLTPTAQRDVRRYYNYLNARMKGWRRRNRQLKTWLSKMARKGIRARHLSRN